MLAVLTVTTNQDVVDANDSVVSLREAITNANAVAGTDIIEFDFGHDGPETILLIHGELVISTSLAIHGPGPSLLTIDASGNDPTPDIKDALGSRVFRIDNGGSSLENVELHGLRLTGGDLRDAGGAVLALENLLIGDCVIIGNSTQGAGFQYGGGGIFSTPSSTSNPNALIIRDSRIEDNTIEDVARAKGGGIRKRYGSLVINRSTISGNSASYGGGISASDGAVKVQIRDSTVSNNTSVEAGGGILVLLSDADISGCTISGNHAGTMGGGIRSDTRSTLRHCTITANYADADRNGTGAGGGFYGVANIEHSIIAGNLSGDTPSDAFGGAASFSLISAAQSVTNNGGNLIGTSTSLINPMLGPLADNGGPTRTHALLPGSPAIDAGDPGIRGPLAYYRFEESIGAAVATDFIGTNDGVYHGDPRLEQPGIAVNGGNDVSLDGIDDYVSIPRLVAVNFTYSLWVKTSAATSLPMALVGGDVAGSNADYQFSIVSGKPRVQIGLLTLSPDVLINDGQWHHLAVTRVAASGVVQVFIDGSRRANAPSGPMGALAAASDLRIGQLLNGQQPFIGEVDEFAVYDRVLSSSEVYEQAKTGLAVFDQRGASWGRVVNGDDVPEARIDMGAVEWQANPLPGDYNFNGVVDGADYSVWMDTVGSTIELRADGSSAATAGAPDGVVDENDYAWWKLNFGNRLQVGSAAVGSGDLLQAAEVNSTAGQVALNPPWRASSGTQEPAIALSSPFGNQPPVDPEAGYPAGVASVFGSYLIGPSAGGLDAGLPPAEPRAGGRVRMVSELYDAALMAWAARRGGGASVERETEVQLMGGEETEGDGAVREEVFAGLTGRELVLR